MYRHFVRPGSKTADDLMLISRPLATTPLTGLGTGTVNVTWNDNPSLSADSDNEDDEDA